MKLSRDKKRLKRQKRVRRKVLGTDAKPRLNVYRSLKHIYAQLINDVEGITLVSASTASKEKLKDSSNINGAKSVGIKIAEKAQAKNIKNVVFDRNGYKYHGRIKALADAAREKGLKF